MTTDTSSGRQKTDQMKEEGKQLTDEARARGEKVGRQAKEEVSHVLQDARAKAKDQAEDQTHRAADALRGMADQLASMAGGADERGVLVDMAEDGADRIRRFADQVDEGGFDGIVRDLESFARRRPGMYLAAGLGLGMVAGRLLRAADMSGMKEAMTEGTNGDSGRGETPVEGTEPHPIPSTQTPAAQTVGTPPANRPGGAGPGGGL